MLCCSRDAHQALDELEEIGCETKAFMKMWNCFLRANECVWLRMLLCELRFAWPDSVASLHSVLADKHLGRACVLFAQAQRDELVAAVRVPLHKDCNSFSHVSLLCAQKLTKHFLMHLLTLREHALISLDTMQRAMDVVRAAQTAMTGTGARKKRRRQQTLMSNARAIPRRKLRASA